MGKHHFHQKNLPFASFASPDESNLSLFHLMLKKSKLDTPLENQLRNKKSRLTFLMSLLDQYGNKVAKRI